MNMRLDSFEAGLNSLVKSEVSNREIKRHNQQAKLFANTDFTSHPSIEQVQHLLRNGNLQKIQKNASQGMTGKGATFSLSGQEIPQLESPLADDILKKIEKSDKSEKSEAYADSLNLLGNEKSEQLQQVEGETVLTAKAFLMREVLKSGILTNDNSNLLESITNDIKLKVILGDISFYSTIMDKFNNDSVAWTTAVDVLNEAKKQASALLSSVDSAQSKLDKAQSKLDDLQQQASQQNPVPMDLQNQIANAKSEVATAKSNLGVAKANYANFVDKKLNPAIAVEKQTRTAVENSKEDVEKFLPQFTARQIDSMHSKSEKDGKKELDLNSLLAIVSELLDNSSNEDIKYSAELRDKIAKASAADNEKKLKEFEEKTRQAEDLQKTMGCIGKAIGWIITGVSFVAAAFTGGASLALAGIGLALAVGDEVSQAVTGHSFIADAMKPIMEGVIKPVMDLIAKAYTKVLELAGVDKNTAEMIGNVMAAIATGALMVLGSMVASSVFSKVFGSIVSKLGLAAESAIGGSTVLSGAKAALKKMMDMFRRLFTKIMDKLDNRLFKSISKISEIDTHKLKIVTFRTEKALNYAKALNAGISTSSTIATSVLEIEATKNKNALEKNALMMEIVNTLFDAAVKSAMDRISVSLNTLKMATEMNNHKMKTAREITRNISNAAAG